MDNRNRRLKLLVLALLAVVYGMKLMQPKRSEQLRPLIEFYANKEPHEQKD